MSGGLAYGLARGRRPVCWGLLGAVVAVAVLAAGCGGGQGEAVLPPDVGGPPSDVGGPPGAEGPPFDGGLPPDVGGPPFDGGLPPDVGGGGKWPDGFVLYPGLGRLDAPGGVFTDVAVGGFSSCGVRASGEVVCWGEQEVSGEVARFAPVDGVFTEVVVWQSAENLNNSDHACALRVDGVVVCWGLDVDDAGAARVVARGDRERPVRWELGVGADGASEVFVSIDAGAGGVCTVRDDGAVGCWSGYSWSRHGLPAGGFAEVVVSGVVCGLRPGGGFDCAGGEEPAVRLPAGGFADASIGGKFADVSILGKSGDDSIGLGFGCGVRVGGALVCWGDNGYGQADPPAGRYTQVSAGLAHACALGVGGRAVCWGENLYGQSNAPDGEFARVEVAWAGSCGVGAGGGLVCWGWDRPSDRLFSPEGSFAAVAMNGALVCGLRDSGSVACWMQDGRALWAPEEEFKQIAAVSGSSDVCGLRPDGAAQCWDALDRRRVAAPEGAFAQIPDGAEPGDSCWLGLDRSAVCWQRYRDTPAIPDGTFDEIIAAGKCGIAAETGEVSCWDSFMTGAVGEPPESVLPLLGVSGGGGVFCGISAADRSLACWPPHSRARLQIPGLPGGEFADVSLGPNGAGCAIKIDQELACWGRFADFDRDTYLGVPEWEWGSPWAPAMNFDGGNGVAIDPPQGRYTKVDVGARHACAIGVGGAVACWGHAHDWPYDHYSDRIRVCGEEADICPGG